MKVRRSETAEDHRRAAENAKETRRGFMKFTPIPRASPPRGHAGPADHHLRKQTRALAGWSWVSMQRAAASHRQCASCKACNWQMGQPGNQLMFFVHVRSHLTPSVPLHRHLDERDLNRTDFPSSPQTTSLPPSNAAHVAFAQTETGIDLCLKLRCRSCP